MITSRLCDISGFDFHICKMGVMRMNFVLMGAVLIAVTDTKAKTPGRHN